ncbi:hypothetical protein [Pseudomonas fluorescens]|uniref:Uncharacterized protein n=1 Tax=Pseudomonas fluorescens TaxID=294 RepID=A0A5E7C9M9_PSEFL|nr:hypothetical protein [Pseudomonas fluorescens]VVN92643.1 hypothetical protein PS723_01998 [Pseudomonas fluorescens]
MKTSKKTPITFGSGAAINDEMLYVTSFIDAIAPEINHTRMFVLNLALPGLWFHHDIIDKTVVSVAVRPASDAKPRVAYALCTDGTVETYNSNSTLNEAIPMRENAGSLSSITHIGNRTYACGAENQIFYRSNNFWEETGVSFRDDAVNILKEIATEIKSGKELNILELTKKTRTLTLFECIKGTSENNIYTCGTNGMVLHWNGHEWQQSQSGTRQHLHDIHCVTPDDIIMCGHNGVVIRGNHTNGFRRMPIEKTDINFWSVRLFNKSLYLGSTSGLFCVTKNTLIKASFGTITLPSQYSIESIDTTDNTLWVITNKFILRLNTGTWKIIELPDNDQL